MKKFFIMFLSIGLFACTTNKIDEKQKSDITIFDAAIKHIENKNYVSASMALSEIETNFPYSSLVPNSWYLMGYANYKDKKYVEAIDNFQKLLEYQPNHSEADYAMYMIAMSYYDQISPIDRDQKNTEIALKKMQELVKKFPNSEFSEDVKPKIIIAKNNLAAKEMYIANSLVKRKNIIAALNRYQTVIRKHQTTLFVPEALFRTVEIYNLMDEPVDAKNMTRLLEVNYPDTNWYLMAKDIVEN